jgi:hypothetical protein
MELIVSLLFRDIKSGAEELQLLWAVPTSLPLKVAPFSQYRKQKYTILIIVPPAEPIGGINQIPQPLCTKHVS